MEALLLLEYDSRTEGTRQALLGRVEQLARASQGRLRLVATERDEDGQPSREIMAVELRGPTDPAGLVSRWRADAALPAGVAMRLLAIEPVRRLEPIEPLFP
ncbi:hypothetical protein [Bosea sp. (in: a-proteobacteria)]|uniref:hypothetical protein n=1 Tax=Bosea sp. (in: a-proteobacteria) TaxID=1871050 RepID=UPI001AC3D93C|nr:hypothetical protein [Bosea sp. (in: a-proteobacteria)]MBN9442899.1 hypothetical protein [Bosea sp. (in: a-proteobacteria)]